jgi:acyl-CoA oxidase
MTSSPSFNKEDLTTYLDRTCLENRAKWRALSTDPIFKYRRDQTLPQLRELAFERMKKVFASKVVSVSDFKNNPLNIFTAHEMIAQIDASLATKFTVQMNLFGGSMICLGSDRHSWVLSGIDDLSVVGCFALTELGFGNNAVEMQTTAHYDEKTKEFTIHSPTTLSQKYWITNGALHANHAVVFAQLYMPVKGTNEYKKRRHPHFLGKTEKSRWKLKRRSFH